MRAVRAAISIGELLRRRRETRLDASVEREVAVTEGIDCAEEE